MGVQDEVGMVAGFDGVEEGPEKFGGVEPPPPLGSSGPCGGKGCGEHSCGKCSRSQPSKVLVNSIAVGCTVMEAMKRRRIGRSSSTGMSRETDATSAK